ncbi:sugar ABC transporter permease [Clostridia bacterium]|nr:sugar ABC transporter permease [Clostridia bacterium]
MIAKGVARRVEPSAVIRPKVMTPINAPLKNRILKNWQLYLLLLPVIAYYIVFKYWPMYGVQIALRKYMAVRGVWGSPWVGLANFRRFFKSFYFSRLLLNTLKINIVTLLVGFPIPILMALMLNEQRGNRLKKTIQMVTYAPHFISVAVVVGMLQLFFATQSGIVNLLRNRMGFASVAFLTSPQSFLPMYVLSGVWQEAGWNSVIYIAAIAGIDYNLYEAAYLDGAGTLRRIWYVTLPCIAPTIIILLIMRMGSMMNVGFEKIFLMQNGLNKEVSDVISTYVYRVGLQEADYSYSSAVGLFSSVINFALLASVNVLCKRVSEVSLW